MIKYFIVFCIISLSYSCKTSKQQVSQDLNQVAETEEVVEEVEVESTVPDLLTTETVSNCYKDWKNRERLILLRDTDRIGKLADATNGNIFIITQVNRDGYVIKTKIDEQKTTVKKDIWRKMALEIVNEYQFEPDQNAPKIDCGTVKFFLSTM